MAPNVSGMHRSFNWTNKTYAWPRVLVDLDLEGSLRRWNPLSKKPYMHRCWKGEIEWFMFRKPDAADKIVPDNFEELMEREKPTTDATVRGRVYTRMDVPGPAVMTHTDGDESVEESPFWDGHPVDWNALTSPSLENANWRAKVKATVQGLIDSVELCNEAHPGARPRVVDPMWKGMWLILLSIILRNQTDASLYPKLPPNN